MNITKYEASNEPPSSVGNRIICSTDRLNKPDTDFWRSILVCYAIHSRGVAHNLLPVLNNGRHLP